MVDKERALQLLGSGINPGAVATTLGCDPSYISQLLAEEAFRDQVLALRLKNLHAATTRDRQIDEIEDDLLKKLKESVPFIVKTQDLLRAFAILNAAKRRGAQAGGDITLTQNIVSINLPPAARERFITNHNGEVVQVGNRTTVTMPLQHLLKQRLEKTKEEAQNGSQDAPNGQTTHEVLLASLGFGS